LAAVAVVLSPSFSPAKEKNALKNTIDAQVAARLRSGEEPNRLINEKSPYLLQHAFDPVDWYPWGEEAISRARREQKVILLSIGYSTCHWCHVMARESFSDPELARYLNSRFVCIKVDREERPDLDQIYMTAVQSMTGSGGWPLTVFLTPDLTPFYGGTYFPPEPAHGLPSFRQVLEAVDRAWREEREKVVSAAARIAERLAQEARRSLKGEVALDLAAAQAFQAFASRYDKVHGGFLPPPKFPRPVVYQFLLAYWLKSGRRDPLDMTLHSLQKMAAGGMFDHLGGGFHRYSVDRTWLLPHFEKMLYDQAQLAMIYLDGYLVSGRDDSFARVARRTLDYVLRDLAGPAGELYSAEDADSPDPLDKNRHGEGLFYLWRLEEVRELAGADSPVFATRYGLSMEGNLAAADPLGEFCGLNILHLAASLEETAEKHGKSVQEAATICDRVMQKLAAARANRPRPHLDDKVITSWNGLMISALARAFTVLGEDRYLDAAERTARFVLDHLYDPEKKRLFRRYRQGESALAGGLEDYAFLVQGLLDLYRADFDIRWLSWAWELELQMEERFQRPGGGFFDTSGEDPTVLFRARSEYDGAEPCGNSVAASNLLRFARMFDDKERFHLARQTLASFGGELQQAGITLPLMLSVGLSMEEKPALLVIAGAAKERKVREFAQKAAESFLPQLTVLLADNGPGQEWLGRHLPFINEIPVPGQGAVAYVCRGYACSEPTADPEELGRHLEEFRNTSR